MIKIKENQSQVGKCYEYAKNSTLITLPEEENGAHEVQEAKE